MSPPPTLPVPLVARSDDISLAGSVWRPRGDPKALLLMHPGSGPSDRDNGTLFPPIRAALLDVGVAVGSFDKRGVGRSGGSWLDAGIEEQAGDLRAGLAAAAALVPDVPRGVFGHSEGGWVVLEATRLATPSEIDFAITNAGPAVTAVEAERHAGTRALAVDELDAAGRTRKAAALNAFLALAAAGAPHTELLALARERAADHPQLLGDDLPDEQLWKLFVRLAAYDPLPALRSLRVPLLAVFGADDDLTPTAASVSVLRAAVDPALVSLTVLPDAGHRMTPPAGGAFVAGYPDVIVDFVDGHSDAAV